MLFFYLLNPLHPLTKKMVTIPFFAPLLWLAVGVSVILFVSSVGPIFWGAQFVPTPFDTVRRMLRLANVQPGEAVYDLGSGDGRVLWVATREFGARAVGVEIDPLRFAWTRLAIKLLGLGERVRVLRANLFDADLSGADVVVLYLLPTANSRLAPKLLRELRPGARVVSHAFVVPELQMVAEEQGVRLYRV